MKRLDDEKEESLHTLPQWVDGEIKDNLGVVYDIVQTKNLTEKQKEKAILSIGSPGVSFVLQED